ncbi:CYTH and CHAD domain-containing protein [Nonomuraea gerenzanensis]|uniref:CHAD domain containing protein n=1 Tax=Nonomuraea gerenzanensis TaxID=93944 RepID=A0A1M4EQ89_9ACTN|nr:CYTH and CHAD domain-containing protein [Nonomuraea gerenzanensis]UBU12438.1 CYTH and CHAD domain-containing protein [Nonomuraea gerenzanensis]SBP00989.1 CHAD domain containing protein [Nonomuraea gerenzanensis]
MGIEIEDKFDVPPEYVIPDLTGLADVVGPRSHQLVALYFDTPDLRLASRGVTLRRRRGGADAGWHLKLPKAKGVRQEITHPLTRSTKVVPLELAELVRAYTRGAELKVVAELETRRSVTVLKDGETGLVEIADDRVKGTVYGDEPRIVRWREVEAELLDGGTEQLLAKVGKRLRKAGASASGSANKLARLLEPAPPALAATKAGSAGEIVVAYLASQVNALLSQDPRVRRAEEDAVHQMRVAARRLRSALKAFKTVVTDTGEMQEELRWLGNVLGEARDLEVIRARFARTLAGLAPELVTGPIQARLGSDLHKREQEAYERIKEALSGDRYYLLLDALDRLVGRPALGKAAAKPAQEQLRTVAAANWGRVTKAYDRAQAIEDPERREIAMHDVRKAAKRARYTAEALQPSLGADMGKLAKLAENVQEVLGAHQDGVVAQETLAKEAESARQAGEDTFTYGLLIGIERNTAERAHAEFPRVWKETVKAVSKVL